MGNSCSQRIKNSNSQKGFTLIESMIAIVVFSFGLLGVAGLMVNSVKINHNAYMRSQAIFLISSAIDMMHRNTQAVWNEKYNGEYSGSEDTSDLCREIECDWENLAEKDVKDWSNMLTQILPNSTGKINCVTNAPRVSEPGENPFSSSEPYNGFCEVKVEWTESNERSASNLQQLSWVVKP